jgi:hypothetical protein
VQLARGFTNEEAELAIPSSNIYDLVLHQLHSQLRIQQVTLFHLHEALVEQFKAQILFETLTNNHGENLNLRVSFGR